MNARRNSGRTWSGWGRRVNLCLRRPGVDAVPVGGDWRRYRGLGAVSGGVGHHDAVRREVPAGDAGYQCNWFVPDRLSDDHADRTIPTRSEMAAVAGGRVSGWVHDLFELGMGNLHDGPGGDRKGVG